MDRREYFGGEALDYTFLIVSGHKQQAISKLASKEFVHCLVRRKILKIFFRFLLLSRFFLCFDFLSYFLYLAFCYPLLYSQTTCDWKSYSFRSSYLFELPLDALVKMKTLSCVSSLSFFSSLYLSSVFLSRCYSSLVESSWLLWWLLVFFF